MENETTSNAASDKESYYYEVATKFLHFLETHPSLLLRFRKIAQERATKIVSTGKLNKFIKPTDKVAYIGAGTGHVAQEIEDQTKAQIFKFDLSDLRTSDMRDNRFALANARHLPVTNMDTITFIDVLHHCKNIGEILAETFRALKPGGILIIFEDTLPKNHRKLTKVLTSIMDDILNLQPPGANPHNYHSITEWQQMLKQTGFTEDVQVITEHWGPQEFIPKLPFFSKPFESSFLITNKPLKT